MRNLIEELEYIWDWLEDINPDPDLYDFRCYQPGLSRKQISSLTKDLSFVLPEEICQLYGWTNGLKNYCDDIQVEFLFFDHVRQDVTLSLYSLQYAIQAYKDLSQSSQLYKGTEIGNSLKNTKVELWDDSWFPIAGFESSTRLYVDFSVDPSPIIHWDGTAVGEKKRTYKNLNAMISMIAECCELDVYHVVPDEDVGEEYLKIKIDEKKCSLEKEIFQKYNA